MRQQANEGKKRGLEGRNSHQKNFQVLGLWRRSEPVVAGFWDDSSGQVPKWTSPGLDEAHPELGGHVGGGGWSTDSGAPFLVVIGRHFAPRGSRTPASRWR